MLQATDKQTLVDKANVTLRKGSGVEAARIEFNDEKDAFCLILPDANTPVLGFAYVDYRNHFPRCLDEAQHIFSVWLRYHYKRADSPTPSKSPESE